MTFGGRTGQGAQTGCSDRVAVKTLFGCYRVVSIESSSAVPMSVRRPCLAAEVLINTNQTNECLPVFFQRLLQSICNTTYHKAK